MRFWIIALVAGCHFGWSSYQGVRPRVNQSAKVVLHATDDAGRALAKSVLAKDPSIEVVELEPSADTTLDAGCKAARDRGADYYAVGVLAAKYDENYVCTKHDGSILDKREGNCIEGYAENQQSAATFDLTLYASDTCEKSLVFDTIARASGPEDASKPEALSSLSLVVAQKSFRLPTQITIDANGAVDTPDGYYALYRGRDFRGFVAREGTSFRSLHCCDKPSPGDRLVGRGARKLLETAVNFTGGSFQYDGGRVIAGGMGAHVRYYPLDAGVRFGFGFDLIGTPSAKANSFLFFPEIGWGFRPTSAISLSANASFGWARGRQVHMERLAGSYTWLAAANLRVITFFTKWWYLGADVGYAHSGDFGMWEGDGAAMARPMSVRSPLGRIWAGFDL